MSNKRRCTACRGYFKPDEMYRSGISGVCSAECLTALQNKYRAKRSRRQEHRENKHKFGRRLPGRVRDEVRTRDGGCCRLCGVGLGRIEIHHIEYRSQGGPDAAWNLISLCMEHHLMMHSNKRKWQPLLRMVNYIYYFKAKQITVGEAERVFGDQEDELASFAWGFDDVDEDEDEGE